MINVLEILPGGRAVVSTEGLRRVSFEQSGRIIAELMPASEAEALAEAINCCEPRESAEAATYDALLS